MQRIYNNLVQRGQFEPTSEGLTPWDGEPDLVLGTYRGYSYAIIRIQGSGSLNGYINIPEGHCYYIRSASDCDLNVHGGITYSENVLGGPHSTFLIYIPELTGCWWIGFDTAHFNDYVPGALSLYKGTYRDVIFMLGEIEGLIGQLIDLDGGKEGLDLLPCVRFIHKESML
jgi:hypothetical protein